MTRLDRRRQRSRIQQQQVGSGSFVLSVSMRPSLEAAVAQTRRMRGKGRRTRQMQPPCASMFAAPAPSNVAANGQDETMRRLPAFSSLPNALTACYRWLLPHCRRYQAAPLLLLRLAEAQTMDGWDCARRATWPRRRRRQGQSSPS